MKNRRSVNYLMVTIFFMSLLLHGCILPKVEEEVLPVVSTDEITDVSETLAVFRGTLMSNGGSVWVNRGACYSNIVPEPDLKGEYAWADVGDHIGTFTTLIENLTPDTKYYARAYAINDAGAAYGSVLEFTTTGSVTGNIAFNTGLTYGSVNDNDGNTYKTIDIGDQTWMAENLKTTKYNDGTDIPIVTDTSTWVNLSTPAYCWYLNDGEKYKNVYGALYNWHSVSTGKLCPAGWHVPDDTEWETLATFSGGESVAGKQLKEASLTHWVITEDAINNNSGFTALPGGTRWGVLPEPVRYFSDMGYIGYFWSSTEVTNPDSVYLDVYARTFEGSSQECERMSFSKSQGVSVRCIKD